MDTRTKSIIERIEKDLRTQGWENNPVTEKSTTGYGDYDSYFQLLVDKQLEGAGLNFHKEDVWENMKKQINHLRKIILDAERDYKRLTVRYKTVQEDYEDLQRENLELIKE